VATRTRTNLLCLALVAASFVVTGALYGRLPERIPSHWNLAGQVDGYASKPWGPFFVPLTMLALHLLFVAIRRTAPMGYGGGALESVEAAVLAFMFTLSVVGLIVGLGHHVSMNRVAAIGVGPLFVVLGDAMGKLTRNFFAGIRTPWTLANEEVWRRTHRFGGRLWIAGGVVLFVAGLLGPSLTPLLVIVPVLVLVPIVYSYVVYRRVEGPPGPRAS